MDRGKTVTEQRGAGYSPLLGAGSKTRLWDSEKRRDALLNRPPPAPAANEQVPASLGGSQAHLPRNYRYRAVCAAHEDTQANTHNAAKHRHARNHAGPVQKM